MSPYRSIGSACSEDLFRSEYRDRARRSSPCESMSTVDYVARLSAKLRRKARNQEIKTHLVSIGTCISWYSLSEYGGIHKRRDVFSCLYRYVGNQEEPRPRCYSETAA